MNSAFSELAANTLLVVGARCFRSLIRRATLPFSLHSRAVSRDGGAGNFEWAIAVNGLVLDMLRDIFPASHLLDGSVELSDLRRARDADEVKLLRRIAGVADAVRYRQKSL